MLCAENGLSIIENPKPSKGSYADWLGDRRKPSNQEVLKQKIDEIVPICTTFEQFIAKLKTDGYKVNEKRKHISVQAPDWGKAIRFDTLGGDYTEAAIRQRLGKAKTIMADSGSGQQKTAPYVRKRLMVNRTNLLIDIQAKLQQGRGAGYTQWAKIFNLKEAAKTLLFLQENGIDSYEVLKEKTTIALRDFNARLNRIHAIEERQKQIAALQKHIANFAKTKEVYEKYKASGWSRNFYDIHAADIILHREAKAHFDSLGKGKIPKMSQLKQEYAKLAAERKTLYRDYHELKKKSRDLSVACANVKKILNMAPEEKIKNEPHRDTPGSPER